jgi:hypothetical protein
MGFQTCRLGKCDSRKIANKGCGTHYNFDLPRIGYVELLCERSAPMAQIKDYVAFYPDRVDAIS